VFVAQLVAKLVIRAEQMRFTKGVERCQSDADQR
jgi:hypothetical protein